MSRKKVFWKRGSIYNVAVLDYKTETKVKDRGLPTDFPTSRVNRGNQTLLSMLFVIEFEIPKFRYNASLMELCFSRLDYRQFGIHHNYS